MAQQLCIRSLFYSVIMTDQKQRAATHYLSLEGDLKNYCPPDKQNTPAASIWEIKQPLQPLPSQKKITCISFFPLVHQEKVAAGGLNECPAWLMSSGRAP